jgi:4-amino-4-deoxy-L-arabinose transferase-like glycosyltransferase
MALGAIVALGFALRLVRAAQLGPIPDEELVIEIAARVFRPDAPWPLHGGDHPLLGPYLLAASAALFGRSLLGYRLLSILAGTLTLVLTARATASSSNRWVGLMAALVLAVDGLHVDLTSRAFEIGFQMLFVAAAWACLARLPSGGRPALVGASAFLALGFLCSESTALAALALAVPLATHRRLRANLRPADYVWAAAAGLAIISPDVIYNLTATHADLQIGRSHYTNYLDHLARIVHPSLQLQGLGFFLRDAFNAWLEPYPRLWRNMRCEYAGHGVVMGGLLLAGFLHAWRSKGDPADGLWRLPPLFFVLVTTFAGPTSRATLEPPVWTWPAPVLPLVTAATAWMLVRHARRLWPLYVLLVLLFLLPAPLSRVPCD